MIEKPNQLESEHQSLPITCSHFMLKHLSSISRHLYHRFSSLNCFCCYQEQKTEFCSENRNTNVAICCSICQILQNDKHFTFESKCMSIYYQNQPNNQVNQVTQIHMYLIRPTDQRPAAQGVFFFLPSCEPRQCQPDFLWYFVEACCFIQLKIHQKLKFAEIPRTFHL